MITDKLLIVSNYSDIENAQSLGIKIPAQIKEYSKFWFNTEDIKRAYINSDNEIIIYFNDGDNFCFGYDESLIKLLNQKYE